MEIYILNKNISQYIIIEYFIYFFYSLNSKKCNLKYIFNLNNLKKKKIQIPSHNKISIITRLRNFSNSQINTRETLFTSNDNIP